MAVSFAAHPLPGSGCLHPREGTHGSRVGAGSSGSEPLKAPLVRAQWRTRTVLAAPCCAPVEDAAARRRPQGNGHLQCPDRPPLGRFGFAKSPAGQRIALHAVADRPADVGRLLTAQPMSSQLFAIGSRTTGEGRECRSRSETLSAIGPRSAELFAIGSKTMSRGELQIQPALTCPDVTDVTGPFLVGFFRDEVLLQQVRCDVKSVVAVRASSGK